LKQALFFSKFKRALSRKPLPILFLFLTSSLASASVSLDRTIKEKGDELSEVSAMLEGNEGRLRALNPQLKTNETRNRTMVATMGIRGSETTSTIIEPYWKGDKTDDKAYIVELTQYTHAQQYAEDGDLQKAVLALNKFLDEYSDSELRPNAQFALGISQGGLGDVKASKETLQAFVDDNPKHPLVIDAKQVIAEL